MNILLLGGGAREHALGAALCRNAQTRLYVISSNRNPGLERLSAGRFAQQSESVAGPVVARAREWAIDLAVVGLENPLEAGVPDELEAAGIPTIGPPQAAARLETSKLFTRELMQRYAIPGQLEYQYFTDAAALERFLRTSDKQYALKPVGLTAGKGVRVMGLQLATVEEAIDYGKDVIQQSIGGTAGIVVEERLIGEEFTLQAFVDGETIVPMPLVQDFKRAYKGDLGPNTGSMGSYSQPDGLLPFLTDQDRDAALDVMRRLVEALRSESVPYQGIMYGQFMMTSAGPRLVEINARFGDPEAINVLTLLETDFTEICLAIAQRRLRSTPIEFARAATVCKYVTPPGYPEKPGLDVPLRIDQDALHRLPVELYFAKVSGTESEVRTTASRSLAVVGRAASIAEAEQAVERALLHIHGEYHVRHDIGRPELIYRSTRAQESPDPSFRV